MHYDLDIYQMDVKVAYLNGNLDEEIYMNQVEGLIEAGHENQVYQLWKAIYSLKQARWSWYHKIDAYLKLIHLIWTHTDSCIYHWCSSNKVLIITIYINDLLIFSSHKGEIETLKWQLSEKFEMTNLGEAHYILSIEIWCDHERDWIQINQHKYINDVLK